MFDIMYNCKSSAGFRTSAMYSHIQSKDKCWLFFLLQRRQKASTTLGIVREYNTCIVQPPIIKYNQNECIFDNMIIKYTLITL